MLHGVKQLMGFKLGALDGEIGHVKGFYFDDKDWVIRYLVADTGSWMPGRKVLISPYALGRVHEGGQLLEIKQSREKIQKSPSIDTHPTVARQHEVEYYRYYNWPVYWGGPGLWGPNPTPIPTLYESPPPKGPAPGDAEPPDSHLRSTGEVSGYVIQALDGEVGRVTDYLIDDNAWQIEWLVVSTGHWWSGKDVLVPTKAIQQVSWAESKVFVGLTRSEVAAEPEYHPAGPDDSEPRIFKK